MIITDTATYGSRQFTRTHSDTGYMIERNGVQYSEAVDPIDSDRQYTETDILIDNMEVA